jgi:CDP-diacylglycerol--glycerol-3-phosphate 3-phosphatidyltransferase
MAETSREPSKNLTDTTRVVFKSILDPIGKFLNRLGLMPNHLTLLGVLGNIIGTYFVAIGQMTIGGIIILLMGPIDALDGTMARLRGMSSKFGAFVDSVADRYSELIIFGGLIYYFTTQGEPWQVLLVYIASVGSFLVSYIRARGQSLGWDTKVGILTRMERFLVLSPALILTFAFGEIAPIIGIAIIAIFANFTALQRIIDIRRQAYQKTE